MKITNFKYIDKNKYTKKCKSCLRFVRKRNGKKIYSYYTKWCKKCFDRDGYKCIDCGYNNYYGLVVHHLDESRKTGKLNNELSNLVTLCRSCHAIRHSETEDRSDIVRMRNGGLTFREIADMKGVSRQRIHQIYKKYVSRQDRFAS